MLLRKHNELETVPCEARLKKLYFRISEDGQSKMIALSDRLYCEVCNKLIRLEEPLERSIDVFFEEKDEESFQSYFCCPNTDATPDKSTKRSMFKGIMITPEGKFIMCLHCGSKTKISILEGEQLKFDNQL
jgi:hypothetical protein